MKTEQLMTDEERELMCLLWHAYWYAYMHVECRKRLLVVDTTYKIPRADVAHFEIFIEIVVIQSIAKSIKEKQNIVDSCSN